MAKNRVICLPYTKWVYCTEITTLTNNNLSDYYKFYCVKMPKNCFISTTKPDKGSDILVGGREHRRYVTPPEVTIWTR